MPDFEQLNFKVEAQDNATKTLNKILKTLNELEKKMNGLSKFKMPNIGLTNEQVKLLNNWDKLDKKLQKVEQDLKSVGKVQKQLEKFEIVPKGKPLFTYDAATQSYIDNNLGVARREAEKLKKELERQGIQDIIKGWGKGQLALPMPPEYKAYKNKNYSSSIDNLNDYLNNNLSSQLLEDELEISSQIDEYLKNSKYNINEIKQVIKQVDENTPKIDWLKNFNQTSGDFRLDDAINQLETMNKKQRAYFNSLRSLENAEIALKLAKEKRDKAYLTYDEDKIRAAELSVNRAENAYLKARNAEIKARQEMEKYNQYPEWSKFGKDLKPYKIKRKQLEGDGIEETQIFKEQVGDLEYTYEVVDGKVKKITSSTKKATKEAIKLQKAFKGVQKFIKSIGKIVLYRAIRSAMAEIKKAIQSSQEYLAKFDSSYNETISKLVTSLDVLKASMGLIIRPFVEVIEPAIGNIVDLFAQVGNYISYATAKSKGLSTYIKINAGYAKDYLESLQQANNLLSFDKFEVLQKQETKDIYEEASIADGIDASENIKDIGDFLINGSTSLESVINILKQIVKLFESLRLLEPLSAISGIVDGILDVVEGIFTLNFDLLNTGIERIIAEIVISIGNIFIGLVNMWIKLFEKIFSWFGYDVDLKGLDYLSLNNEKLTSASNYANNKIYGNDATTVRNSLDQQLASKAVVEIDFKNVNNNAIARELAGSMADQFKKQNIKVSYT